MNKPNKTILLLGLVFFIEIVIPTSPETQEVRYTPQVRIGGEYSDNIFFERNDRVSDFIYNINPAVKIDYRTERLHVNSAAVLNLRRYSSETLMDREDQYYNLSSRYRFLERLTIGGRVNYEKDVTLESRTFEIDGFDTDITDDGEFGIERFLSGRKHFYAMASSTYRLNELTNWTTRYRYANTEYSFERNTDYEVNEIWTSITRKMKGQKDSFGANLSFKQNSSEVSKANSYFLTAIWHHYFSSVCSLRNRVGVRYTEQHFNGTRDSKTNWHGVADIRFKRFGENYEINIGFKQDLRTASDGRSVNVSRLYGDSEVGLSERLLFKVEGDIYLTREDGDRISNEESIYFEVIPTIEYLLTENYSLTVGYSCTIDYDYDRRDGREIQRNRVWVALKLSFPKEL